MQIKTLVLMFVCAMLTVSAQAQPVLTPYRFDPDAEGWSAIDIPAAELCAVPGNGVLQPFARQTNGHPGGYFFYREPSNTGIDPVIRAAASIAGDRSAAIDGFIRFDRRLAQTNTFTFAIVDDVYLQGVVEGVPVTLIANTNGVPYPTWQAQRVPLRAGVWRKDSCSGPVATRDELLAVLQNVVEVKLKAEYRSGQEDHGIDNFMLVAPGNAVISTFETDTGGWSAAGDLNQFGWVATDGIEMVQCLRVVDAVQGSGIVFVAPPSFLGDQLASLGKSLEFDLRSTVDINAAFSDGGGTDFVTLRSGNTRLNYHNSNLPIVGNRWRHQSIPLTPSPQWTRGSDGAVATQSDFVAVLSNLSALTIRSEFRSGSETNYLDNIVLGACSPAVTVSPAQQLACRGETASMTSIPAGDGPFTFQWTKGTLEISPEMNPSATSARLLLPNLQASDTATYACIVVNACGSVTSNPVALLVCIADFNCDRAVDLFDYLDFVDGFSSNQASADFNGDGIIDFFDYLDFVDAFSTGC